MALQTGITVNTAGRLLLGAGTLTVGGTSVGATTGEGTFSVTRTILTPQLNGAAGPVKGTEFVTEEIAMLSMTLTEMTAQNLSWALPNTSVTSDASSEQISGGVVTCIDDSDYNQIVWTGQDCEGDNVTITLDDAIMVDDLEITFSDEDIAQFDVSFRASYNRGDPDNRPWKVVIDL